MFKFPFQTHGKCAYCESQLLHIAFGDVEHVAPKNPDISLTFLWTNLTLACDKCNTYKSTTPNIFDPYNQEPGKAFNFAGPMIFPKPDHPVARITEKKLQLNRSELVGMRAKRLSAVADQLLLIDQEKDEALKQILVEDLILNEMSDKSEYAAFVRSLIALVNPEIIELATTLVAA